MPVVSLEQKLAGLSPEQRRLMEALLRKQQASAAEAPALHVIPRRRATDPSLLSFAQQRLWLLQQLEPDSPAYNLRTIVRLSGRLDSAVLERSLNEIAQRHEVLRTTFASEDGQPRQVIAATFFMPLPLADLSDVPASEQADAIQRLAHVETEQPFDLERGPLWRVRLARLSADEHLLLLTMHHIISDGWSQGVQLRELMALYAAFVQGKPAALAALPIQYADYALWQRQSFQGPALREKLAYWKNQLGHTNHLLDLPTDRPRPAMATYRGSWDYFTLPAALLERIKEVGRREGATLFMLLLTAFNILLYRYSGQSDVVVGTPVAGRSRSELEGLIGCFLNMLALRTNLGGDPTVHELLQRVRKITLDAYAHQDVPIEKLIEDLQLERNLSRNAIFQVMFVLQNMPMPALKSSHLTLSPMEVTSTTSILDMSLYAREVEKGLLIRVEYNTDLFNAETIRRMLGHFHMLLAGIVVNPNCRLSELSLLTDNERQQLPAVEEALAGLWAAMLGCERVERHDNFFVLGGDPAKAAQLMTRIGETFQVALSLRSLFAAPTVAAMAEMIIAREAKPGQSAQIAGMLARIRGMSATDRQRLLEQKRKVRSQA